MADDIDGAKNVVSRHRGSVWIGKGESQAQWGLAPRRGLRLVEGYATTPTASWLITCAKP